MKNMDDFISYVSSLIDEISDVIINKDKLSYNEFILRISNVILAPHNRIMLGVLIVVISFVLYILDITTE